MGGQPNADWSGFVLSTFKEPFDFLRAKKRKRKRVGEEETKDSMEAACLEKCQNFMIFYSESFHFHIHHLTPDPQAKIQALKVLIILS